MQNKNNFKSVLRVQIWLGRNQGLEVNDIISSAWRSVGSFPAGFWPNIYMFSVLGSILPSKKRARISSFQKSEHLWEDSKSRNCVSHNRMAPNQSSVTSWGCPELCKAGVGLVDNRHPPVWPQKASVRILQFSSCSATNQFSAVELPLALIFSPFKWGLWH